MQKEFSHYILEHDRSRAFFKAASNPRTVIAWWFTISQPPPARRISQRCAMFPFTPQTFA